MDGGMRWMGRVAVLGGGLALAGCAVSETAPPYAAYPYPYEYYGGYVPGYAYPPGFAPGPEFYGPAFIGVERFRRHDEDHHRHADHDHDRDHDRGAGWGGAHPVPLAGSSRPPAPAARAHAASPANGHHGGDHDRNEQRH